MDSLSSKSLLFNWKTLNISPNLFVRTEQNRLLRRISYSKQNIDFYVLFIIRSGKKTSLCGISHSVMHWFFWKEKSRSIYHTSQKHCNWIVVIHTKIAIQITIWFVRSFKLPPKNCYPTSAPFWLIIFLPQHVIHRYITHIFTVAYRVVLEEIKWVIFIVNKLPNGHISYTPQVVWHSPQSDSHTEEGGEIHVAFTPERFIASFDFCMIIPQNLGAHRKVDWLSH